MATITNALSASMNTSAVKSAQSQMKDLRNQYRDGQVESQEYKEKMSGLKQEYNDARMAAAASAFNEAKGFSSMFSYMNNFDNSGNSGSNSVWGGGTFDTTPFITSKGDLSQLQAMNAARIGIESRARSLVGEISRDKAMGLDVKDKQTALANLTGNLDILSRNLSSSIDRALAETSGKSSNYVDIIDKIRKSLAPDEPKEVEKEEAPESSEAESKSESAEAASVAAQIANSPEAEYAESEDIMKAESPEIAVANGVSPAF